MGELIGALIPSDQFKIDIRTQKTDKSWYMVIVLIEQTKSRDNAEVILGSVKMDHVYANRWLLEQLNMLNGHRPTGMPPAVRPTSDDQQPEWNLVLMFVAFIGLLIWFSYFLWR